MNENRLIMMMGFPRSGKSTWAKWQNCPIVNPDAIRLALHGRPFIAESEPMVWAIAKYMVRSLFLAGHDTVILDATNTTLKRRTEWKSSHWKILINHITTSASTCKERAIATGRDDLIPVIDRMAAAFEPITDDETRWPIPYQENP